MRPLFALLVLAMALLFGGCSQLNSDDDTYTLYRNSVLDPAMRVHVATFDAADGDSYNSENCHQVEALISAQKDLATRFWCEKGRFRK